MKAKTIVLGFLFLLLTRCNQLQEDCSTVLCVAQSLAIAFVDDNGTNLIANGTYTMEEISVFKGDNQVNFNSNLNEVIFIFLSGKKGENTYEIDLGNGEMDTLVLDLVQTSSGGDCCSPYFSINNVTYDSESIDLEIDEQFGQKITIVK